MSEENPSDGFESAKERVEKAYQDASEDTKSKVEAARAEALKKLRF